MHKVLILSSIDCNADFNKIFRSVHLITYCLYEAFKALGIETYLLPYSDNNLPEVDFVIGVVYVNDDFNIQNIKKKTKCLKVVSLREIIYNKFDYYFVFNIEHWKQENTTYIKLPCPKNLLQNLLKEPRSIAIDHCWPPYNNDERDWTNQISDWLQEKKENFQIYRMIRDEKYDLLIKKDYEKPIDFAIYPQYLEKTNHLENFIITHKEGYTYGIIDMVARGIRVITPKQFVPKCVIDDLCLPTFSNKEELFQILEKRPNDDWNKRINLCTDYKEIAYLMNLYFKKWIREASDKRVEL
jgi:hypothetical protein